MDANTVHWNDLSLAEQVAHKRFLRKMASATRDPDDDDFLRYTPEELKFLEQENQENS